MIRNIIFLFIVLILSACSPQVTEETDCCLPVTTVLPSTSTPIPTPTLHPDFVALQNLISDSSNLVLLPDGTIEHNGLVIPNLHVDQNGVINLIINNEHVAIEQSQITFDDENGLIVEGYELDTNDQWVEAIPSPEDLWQEELIEWQLNAEDYRTAYDVNGEMVVIKKSTQEIFKIGDKWNLDVMRRMIASTDVEGLSCYETEWVGTKGQSIGPSIDGDRWFKLFSVPFAEKIKTELIRLGVFSDYPTGFIDFVGGENNCWASTRVKLLGDKPDNMQETYIFWLNENKDLLYKKVFGPKVVKVELVD